MTLLLLRIALRNLLASRLKMVIVGGLVAFGAFLVVVGGSLIGGIDRGMQRSIVGSVAGHLQVYSSKSKDDFAIWGSFGGSPDLTPLDDFPRLKRALVALPEVATVVPMGLSNAMQTSGNSIDLVLEKLRAAVGAGKRPETAALATHVRRQVGLLTEDLDRMRELTSDAAIDPADIAAIAKASSPSFWSGFDRDPLAGLEFLENRIAPLATDSDLLWLEYIGTDLDQFRGSFDRLEVVDGTYVPAGRRGFLFSKFFYETNLKLKIALRLDQIAESLASRSKTIAKDERLQRQVRENVAQVKEIMLQLDPLTADEAAKRLRAELRSSETDPAKLLASFLTMDDRTFPSRYKAFYERLAPLVTLYRVPVGGTLTIKAFTRAGYMRSVNLKVYGTFRFKGLEKSALSGSLNLMDLISFRELYGYLTPDNLEEIRRLQAGAGARRVNRETAEADLFGSGSALVTVNGPSESEARGGHGLAVPSGLARARSAGQAHDRVYTQAEFENGTVMNAAILVKDPRRIARAQRAIETLARREGFALKVIPWQKAAGMVGHLITALQIVLYTMVFVIFLVALVIINNAMVIATLERVNELGTLRAIGAQRGFLLAMLLVEGVVISVVFGLLGAGAGAVVVAVLGHFGIAAPSDELYFFFSGPRLFPAVEVANLAGALLAVLVVGVLANFYPAWLAMRVTPRQAMAAGD
ncbi:MAG: FtsX-like permease family protein [bacterium]